MKANAKNNPSVLGVSLTDNLRALAFDKSAQASIIFNVKTGVMLLANGAACKLLGYTQEEILCKKKSGIFENQGISFKKMLLKRKKHGQATAQVNAILKNTKLIPCEISSAVFTNSEGAEASITTITDLRTNVAVQKRKDINKEKHTKENLLKVQLNSEEAIQQANDFLRYFAETSYDVMWDWDVNTGNIYVGESVKDVFGYKIKGNFIEYATFIAFLQPGQQEAAKKKMQKVLASSKKQWEDSFLIRRKDGMMAATTSRACILRDAQGVAVRLIGATQDISCVLALEKKINEQAALHQKDTENFRLTAKLSFDVIWDWDLASNEVFIGEGFKELFGYRIKKNKGNMIRDWVNYIHPADKELIASELSSTIKSKATQWKHAYRIIKADGTIAKVFARASIMRDKGGRAYRMIGAVQDLTRQKELEAKLDIEIKNNSNLLAAYKENFKLIFNSPNDILYDVDLLANTVVLSDAYEAVLGYKVIGNSISGDEWMSRIHPGDKEALLTNYQQVLATKECEWKYSFRYLKGDGSTLAVQGNSVILRHSDGIAYRLIGLMHDGEQHKKIEDKMSLEISLREEAMADAIKEARVSERSEIGKELHDNVNQLLGASKLYIEMAKKGGKDSEMFLSRSSEYTLTAIEEIRKLTKGLTNDTLGTLSLCESINNIASAIMEVQPLKITMRLDPLVESLTTNKVKLNLFRIVQEQLNNIIKHAKASAVILSLSREGNEARLIIADDGMGFDTSKTRQGIGLANIMERVALIKGTSELVSKEGAGTSFILKFTLHVPEL